MLFCPEDGSDFKDSLINAHHHLLVKLRGLPQESLAAKVVQAENVGAALCTGQDDFGSMDLGETEAVKGLSEGTSQGILNTKDGALLQIAQDYWAQRKLGIQVEI